LYKANLLSFAPFICNPFEQSSPDYCDCQSTLTPVPVLSVSTFGNVFSITPGDGPVALYLIYQ